MRHFREEITHQSSPVEEVFFIAAREPARSILGAGAEYITARKDAKSAVKAGFYKKAVLAAAVDAAAAEIGVEDDAVPLNRFAPCGHYTGSEAHGVPNAALLVLMASAFSYLSVFDDVNAEYHNIRTGLIRKRFEDIPF